MPVFTYIKKAGNIEEKEMLSTFNCGVGPILIVEKQHAEQAAVLIKKYHDRYGIGEIRSGNKKVVFKNQILI